MQPSHQPHARTTQRSPGLQTRTIEPPGIPRARSLRSPLAVTHDQLFIAGAALFFLLGLAGIAALLAAQRRANRSAEAAGRDTEWSSLALDGPEQPQMTLWRLLPTSSVTRVEYSLESDAAASPGVVCFPVGGPAELTLGGLALNAYPQGSGLFATRWHGKVGGRSNRSIVVRDSDRIFGEILCERKFPPPQLWRLDWPNHSLIAVRPGFWTYQKLDVLENGRLVARSRRPDALAQKILLAARRDLPPDLILAVAYLSLLR
jgi:hypothetical protein